MFPKRSCHAYLLSQSRPLFLGQAAVLIACACNVCICVDGAITSVARICRQVTKAFCDLTLYTKSREGHLMPLDSRLRDSCCQIGWGAIPICKVLRKSLSGRNPLLTICKETMDVKVDQPNRNKKGKSGSKPLVLCGASTHMQTSSSPKSSLKK